jgi:transcriptional regulator with XRE-family HTH domain
MDSSELGTLGEFLSASRARLSPDSSFESGPTRRRVPGSRREEVAALAGVSASYYTRLEQGQVTTASPQVIDAISRALHLSAPERDHLHVLVSATAHATRTAEPPEEFVSQPMRDLLASMHNTPAMVLGRRRDILAWNPAGHSLLGGHLNPDVVDDSGQRPNATELVFLDPMTRDLYVDWEHKALASVGHLRMLAAQYPSDSRLLSLVGTLTVRSDEFASMWATHRVRTSAAALYRMRHPLLGEIDVTQQTLTIPDAADQSLVVCTAPPHSESARALEMLARMAEG